MKQVLIAIFSGALMLGIAVAQDNSAPASGSPSSEPQSSAPAQPQTQPPASEPQAPAAQATPDSMAQAPRTSATSAPAGGVKKIAPGSVIPVLLAKTVDAKKAKTGDEVVAKIAQDLKSNSGEVIFAKDTKVMGHVTEAQARSKDQKESQVGITFDRAVMKNGSEMQIPMSIQAIIGSQNDPANAAGGNGEPTSPSAGSGAPASAGNDGRTGTMGGSTPPPPPSASNGGGNAPSDAQAANTRRPPITSQTQGVVGLSNLKLESSNQGAAQGSVVTSEKNNVKLESGTMMLLRVNE
jgi:hypothetical protein